MNTALISSGPPPSNGRRVVALIAALLALPFVSATLLWHFGWQPGRQMNHGELLASADRPLLQLRENDLQKISGNATLAPAVHADSAILGRWLLALAVPAECAADCLAQLQLARQVQVSLNKDMGRLRRALIGPQLDDQPTLAIAQQRWPDLVIARPSPAGWQTLASPDGAAHLVLIDPEGRLVLRYPLTPDAKGVRRDVERLLKYSWTG